jgi:hypothetical protein
MHSFFVGNQGSHNHDHPILSLPFHNYGRILEGPPSMMGSPLPSLSCQSMHLLNAFNQRVSHEHYGPQSFLIGQCIHDTFFMNFLARILIILGCQRFIPPSFRFFFLNLNGIQQPLKVIFISLK